MKNLLFISVFIFSFLFLSVRDLPAQWLQQLSGTSETLFFVSCLTSDIVSVCGAKGTILRTNNSGITWSRQTTGTASNLKSISFIDSLNGLCVKAAEQYCEPG